MNISKERMIYCYNVKPKDIYPLVSVPYVSREWRVKNNVLRSAMCG